MHTEDEFFGGKGTAGAAEAPGWMECATRTSDLTQRNVGDDGDGVATVAFFADSDDAVVSRDVVLHEKRAIARSRVAALDLQEYVSHVHRLRASDNQDVARAPHRRQTSPPDLGGGHAWGKGCRRCG